jgi:hypothetical protein
MSTSRTIPTKMAARAKTALCRLLLTRLLDGGPATATGLARDAGLDLIAALPLLARLQARGLARRLPGPTRGRGAAPLAITTRGQRWLVWGRRHEVARPEELADGLGRSPRVPVHTDRDRPFRYPDRESCLRATLAAIASGDMTPRQIYRRAAACQQEWKAHTEFTRRGVRWRQAEGGDILPEANPMRCGFGSVGVRRKGVQVLQPARRVS